MSMDARPLDDALVRPPRGERPPVRPLDVLRWSRSVDLGTIRAAVWALRACRRIHARGAARALAAPELPRVPAVSVGVAVDRPGGLRAHAWLSSAPEEGAGYEEIARVPPRRAA